MCFCGYRLGHRVSKEARLAAIEASGGECVECGTPGIHVVHVVSLHGAAYSKVENLQLVCERCHLIRAWGFASYEEREMLPAGQTPDSAWYDLTDEFIRRAEAEPALKACDDKAQWKREYLEIRASRHR
jgi:hypothetical protein